MNQPLLTLLSGIKQLLSKKQDKLTAGENITISEDNTISATGGGGDSSWEAGSGNKSVQQKDTTSIAEGDYSVAEGYNTLTKSDYSHSEGWATRTIVDTDDQETFGHASHAEGSHTIARGAASHAEGNTTESKGMYSHAEGAGSLSGGMASHAEGNGAVTNNLAEHAEGSYNKSNTNSILFGSGGNTLHSIGIGTSMADSKNAFEVMQNGDAYMYGVGEYDGTNPDEAGSIQEMINSKMGLVITGDTITFTNIYQGAEEVEF